MHFGVYEGEHNQFRLEHAAEAKSTSVPDGRRTREALSVPPADRQNSQRLRALGRPGPHWGAGPSLARQ